MNISKPEWYKRYMTKNVKEQKSWYVQRIRIKFDKNTRYFDNLNVNQCKDA